MCYLHLCPSKSPAIHPPYLSGANLSQLCNRIPSRSLILVQLKKRRTLFIMFIMFNMFMFITYYSTGLVTLNVIACIDIGIKFLPCRII